MTRNTFKKSQELLGYTRQDVSNSLSLWRFFTYRAWVRYKLRYRGARLGLWWPIISVCMVVGILGSIWSIILGREDNANYYLYLLAGFPVWQFIAASVREGAKGTSGNISSGGLPFTTYIFEKVTLNALPLMQLLPAIILVAIALYFNRWSHFAFLPLALVCLLAWSIGVLALLIVITTLKPDFRHFIESLMRLSFLATPIVWEPTRLGSYMEYLWLNPFFIPLEFMRYSLTGILYVDYVVWAAPVYTLSVLIIGSLLFSRYINLLRSRAAGL